MIPPLETRDPRPTLHTIAGAADVSVMTVSRALRNHPEVAARTRTRVLKIAAALGYRPDPAVTKLMMHLRSRRKPAFQASICALTDVARGSHHPYMDKVLSGAQLRAEALGYGFNLLHLKEMDYSAKRLQRVLRSQGVEGILLLPMAAPVELGGLLDWNEFSIVAATASVVSPLFRQVVPRHFGNTLTLCRELARHGYRRIGLALEAAQDSRVNHEFTAAVTWHGHYEAASLIPPFLYSGPGLQGLEAWFERENPDVLVLGREDLLGVFRQMLKLRVPGGIGFASTNTVPESGLAGIDELPDEIGAMAIDALTGMIQRGEKGAPAVPTAVMISGRWVVGRSCPRIPRSAQRRIGRQP